MGALGRQRPRATWSKQLAVILGNRVFLEIGPHSLICLPVLNGQLLPNIYASDCGKTSYERSREPDYRVNAEVVSEVVVTKRVAFEGTVPSRKHSLTASNGISADVLLLGLTWKQKTGNTVHFHSAWTYGTRRILTVGIAFACILT